MPGIKALLDDLLNTPNRPLEEVMEAHLTPAYRQRTDGAWSTREEVAQHFGHLRSIVESADVRVHGELTDPPHYAERHTVVINKRDGTRVIQEVYVFGDVAADGRFARLEETTMMIEGDETDRAIGNARE